MTVSPSHTRLYATPSKPLASPNRSPTAAPPPDTPDPTPQRTRTCRPHPPRKGQGHHRSQPQSSQTPFSSSHTEAPHPQVPSRLHAPACPGPLPLSAPCPAPRPQLPTLEPRSREAEAPAGRRTRSRPQAAGLPGAALRPGSNGLERSGGALEAAAGAGPPPGAPAVALSPPAPASASRAPPAPAGCPGSAAAPPCCASPCWAEAGGGARRGAVPARRRPPGGARAALRLRARFPEPRGAPRRGPRVRARPAWTRRQWALLWVLAALDPLGGRRGVTDTTNSLCPKPDSWQVTSVNDFHCPPNCPSGKREYHRRCPLPCKIPSPEDSPPEEPAAHLLCLPPRLRPGPVFGPIIPTASCFHP